MPADGLTHAGTRLVGPVPGGTGFLDSRAGGLTYPGTVHRRRGRHCGWSKDTVVSAAWLRAVAGC